MLRPFPGMDPYVEALGLWEGFHAPLVTNCAQALNQHLPEGYVAKIETRVELVTREIPGSERIPDVLVARESHAPRFVYASTEETAGVATIEPVTIPLGRGEVELRERWIEVSTLPDMELVTVIEILSPTNKSGSGRSEYLQKRDTLIERPVNLVEIDLLLGGRPMPMGKTLPAGHYHAIVARDGNRPNAEVYSWSIRHVLPPIPIPLRAPDADVQLDLNQAFEMTYCLGRFNRIVRYDSPLPAHWPLSPADRAWAETSHR
jgi:hypothetical protein